MRLITIGRWTAELHRRAFYITRQPDRNCPECGGTGGGWVPHGLGADWNECPCLDQIRTWRIPLAPRRRYPEEEPF